MRAAIGCALAVAIVSSAACHTMRSVPLNEALVKNRVWLTLPDQSVVVVDGPQVYGNKLVGFVNGKYQEFPTADLKEAHVRETHTARTALLLGAGVVAFGGFIYTVLGNENYSLPDDYCDQIEHKDEPICEA